MTFRLILTAALLAATAASFYKAYDPMLWWLEAAPVLVGFALLAVFCQLFPLTNFTYVMIFLSFLLILIGAHYTYEKVPLFSWLRDEYGLARNHYDRVGHFFQGVVPAIVLREILLRTGSMKAGAALTGMIVLACLGFSAVYELAEWLASYVVEGSTAEWFLGLQGDQWDTQKDMALATLGAALSLLLFSRAHDHALANFKQKGRA